MKLLDTLARRLGYTRPAPAPAARHYAGAAVNRLTEDWGTVLSSADSEIAQGGRRLRSRARELERNNPYIERYLKLLENNVLGSSGIGLQMKVRDPDRTVSGELVKGKYDSMANQTIEGAWFRFGRARNCTVDGITSWIELQKLVLRSTARDGFCFLIKRRGESGGEFNFSIQFLEADLLREDYDGVAENGNIIRMGVELDKYRRPVAYHFYTRNPYETGIFSAAGIRCIREPAENVVHVFRRTRQGQTTGVTWFAPVMLRIKMLDGYDEAELVAARTAACAMGAFEKSVPDGYQGPLDTLGNPTQEMQPGVIMDLPMGVSYKVHSAEHPTSAYPAFIKSCLRSIASGLGVSYNSLASDLEGVNYSSIRAGLLEEREEWKSIQNWFIETVIEPVFDEWLQLSLLSGLLTMPNGAALPAVKLDKFRAADWKPRRWQWVDPEKDVDANIKAIANGFTSRRAVIAEGAGDIEDVDADIAEDEAMEKRRGLLFAPRAESNKSKVDSYGVAVRSGVVTPNAADEVSLRESLGLPAMPTEVVKAWKDLGGVKQTITMTNLDTFNEPANAAASISSVKV